METNKSLKKDLELRQSSEIKKEKEEKEKI